MEYAECTGGARAWYMHMCMYMLYMHMYIMYMHMHMYMTCG